MQLQDEVLVSDTDRLSMTQSNVKKVWFHMNVSTCHSMNHFSCLTYLLFSIKAAKALPSWHVSMDPTIEAARAGYSETSSKGDILSPCFLIKVGGGSLVFKPNCPCI